MIDGQKNIKVTENMTQM